MGENLLATMNRRVDRTCLRRRVKNLRQAVLPRGNSLNAAAVNHSHDEGHMQLTRFAARGESAMCFRVQGKPVEILQLRQCLLSVLTVLAFHAPTLG